MSSLISIAADVPERLALHESDDSFLRWVDETEARAMIKAGLVELLRTKRKLRALRYRSDCRQASNEVERPLRRGIPAGTPHKNENYWNIQGVWHFDPIPKSQDIFFRSILRDRIAA